MLALLFNILSNGNCYFLAHIKPCLTLSRGPENISTVNWLLSNSERVLACVKLVQM